MKHLAASGTARESWRASRGEGSGDPPVAGADPEDVEPGYFGWEIARCAVGSRPESTRGGGAGRGVRRGDARGEHALAAAPEALASALMVWGLRRGRRRATLVDRARRRSPAIR